MIFHMFRSAVVVVDDAHSIHAGRGANEGANNRERDGEKLGLMKKREEVERRACIGLV